MRRVLSLAPAHARTRHQPVKEARVQFLENRIQIIKMTARRTQPLASTHLPDQVCLTDDFVAADILAIARRLPAVNRMAIHLGQQDVRDGPQNRFRRAFQQIREPHQQPAIAQPNRIVNVGEGEEFDLQLGQGSARPQLLVSFLEDFEQAFAHGEA